MQLWHIRNMKIRGYEKTPKNHDLESPEIVSFRP